jgi:hypothetical protein
MDTSFTDVQQIRDLIERWVVYRDSLLWDKFRTVWHDDGVMTATWTTGPIEDFIKITQEGVKNGLNIMHLLGGSAIEVNGNRAVSMTRFMILQRAMVEGVLCDVTCYARHYDLWEKRGERWGLIRRETIADKDRIDPVDNTKTVVLDNALLEQYPIEYRHLAYLQTKVGYNVDKDCPRLSGGKSLEALYQKGADWLKG